MEKPDPGLTQTDNPQNDDPHNTLVVHALNQTTKPSRLSTPHLIAMDNEEAEIVVGRNVPFITSTSQSTVSTVQSVQRENVGITLRFTPQITEGDYIQLELYQEISSLIESRSGRTRTAWGRTPRNGSRRTRSSSGTDRRSSWEG